MRYSPEGTLASPSGKDFLTLPLFAGAWLNGAIGARDVHLGGGVPQAHEIGDIGLGVSAHVTCRRRMTIRCVLLTDDVPIWFHMLSSCFYYRLLQRSAPTPNLASKELTVFNDSPI